MPYRSCNPAFLVEGHLEQAFVQNVCPGTPVRRIGCNGDDVSVIAIAKRVATHGRLLQRRYDPLVVIFDRERREETAEELELALRQALRDEGICATTLIGIPDRDIEVWLLADPEVFRQCARVSNEVECKPCEGYKGKAAIKHLLGVGRTYVESVDGPQWLKKARASEIRKNSPSFARLFDALERLDCWWLKETSLI